MKSSTFFTTLILLLTLVSVGCKENIVDEDPFDSVSTDHKSEIDLLVHEAGEPQNASEHYKEGTKTRSLSTDLSGGEWSCEATPINTLTSAPEFAALNPNAEIVWPGSALQGASLKFNTPDPIIAPRSGGSIVIDNFNGTEVSTVQLDSVSLASVTEAANEIIRNQPGEFPAHLVQTVTRVRSEEELAIAMKANASYFGLFKANASFSFNKEVDANSFLVTLYQPFYTLTFERPSRAAEFFKDGVTADDLKEFVSEGNPPVYISSVVYGRIFYMLIDAVGKASEIETSLNASFQIGPWRGGIDGDTKHISELEKVNVQVYALGGEQSSLYDAITEGIPSLTSFMSTIKDGSTIDQAKPLSYSVRSVRSAKLVKNALHYEYSVKDCAPVISNPDPPTVSWRNYTEISDGREPTGIFEAECKVRDPKRVVVGIGGRVKDDNLTTLVLETAPITDENKIDRSRIEKIKCGKQPDSELEVLLTVGEQEVLSGIALRVKGDNLATVRGLARKLDPQTGKLGDARIIKRGIDPDAPSEVEWMDQSSGSQLLLTGVNARVKGDNIVTLKVNVGEITAEPR